MVLLRAVLTALLLVCTPLAQADAASGGSGGGDSSSPPAERDAPSGSGAGGDGDSGRGADSGPPADEAPGDGGGGGDSGRGGGGDAGEGGNSGGDEEDGGEGDRGGGGNRGGGGDDAPAGQAADPALEDEPAVGPSAAPAQPGGAGGGGGGGGGRRPGTWPKCPYETGNNTHSLLGIINGRYTDRFGAATFSNLLQTVDAATLRVLKDFNVSTEGHTLIVPRNRATNFSDPNLGVEPLFSLYGLDPVFISQENATLIVRNHLINETLTYIRLEAETEAGVPARYKSLGDAVWQFEFFVSEGAVDGTVVLSDTYNVTQERADGILFMQWDISNTKQGNCPNTIFTVDGLLATEETVNPPAPEMAPAPAPFVAPPPLAPRQIIRGTFNDNVTDDDESAPAAAAPASLVDSDRLEALAANQPSGSPPLAAWRTAAAVPTMLATAAVLCAWA
eukprot:jgi/Ulvmu1/7732/UM039_0038.1